MTALQKLGIADRARRTEIGLTQQGLARLSGVSRATINAMETATIHNLSINKASAMLEALGLSLETAANENPRSKASPSRAPLERAASTANVSFGPALTSRQLRDALLQGKAPPQIEPHLHVLLDEAPMSLLGKVVDPTAQRNRDRAACGMGAHAKPGAPTEELSERMGVSANAEGPWRALWPTALDLMSHLESMISNAHWTFGGGTVLMLRYDHRFSKDIDLSFPIPSTSGTSIRDSEVLQRT